MYFTYFHILILKLDPNQKIEESTVEDGNEIPSSNIESSKKLNIKRNVDIEKYV